MDKVSEAVQKFRDGDAFSQAILATYVEMVRDTAEILDAMLAESQPPA